jgi:molybdopterin molybdotransferase
MMGREPTSRPLRPAVLRGELRSVPGKRQYLRGFLDGTDGVDASRATVRLAGGAGSHLLGGLAQANALIVVDEDTVAVADGETVAVLALDRDF